MQEIMVKNTVIQCSAREYGGWLWRISLALKHLEIDVTQRDKRLAPDSGNVVQRDQKVSQDRIPPFGVFSVFFPCVTKYVRDQM
jgi:hypothetical protein